MTPSKNPFLTIRNKIILGFMLLIVLIVIIGLIELRFSNLVRDEFEHLTEDLTPSLLALSDLRYAGVNIISSTNEFVLINSLGVEDDDAIAEEGETEAGQIEAALEQYQQALANYESIIRSKYPESINLFEAIALNGTELLESSEHILSLVEAGADNEEIFEAKEAFEDAEQDFLTAVTAATDNALLEVVAEELELNSVINDANIGTLAAFVISILIAAIVATYVYRSIITPISHLEAGAESIRSARFDVRVPIIENDELGHLSETFNTMAAAIEYRDKEQIAKLQEQLIATESALSQAERSDHVKSAFLASMSHELRTPLNSIINFSKFLVRGMMGTTNPEQDETLGEIIDHREHLLSLINDVLDMSKIESGSLNLFIEDNVDVEEILETVHSTAKTLIDDKAIKISKDWDNPLPLLRGDRQRILQIMLNIVSNACKFTKEGEITISAHVKENSELELAIKDTGAGIEASDYDDVFQPFKQTQTGLRKGGGTGLGMPISKSLAEAHGGRLWFESEVGKGTTFYLRLPILSEELVPIF